MSRHLKIVAERGTDVTEQVWKSFVVAFFDNFKKHTISGGMQSDYIEVKTYIGGFPDVSYYADMFKQFSGSNIALSLYDLDKEPDETFTL